jgi:hypothetical protein
MNILGIIFEGITFIFAEGSFQFMISEFGSTIETLESYKLIGDSVTDTLPKE